MKKQLSIKKLKKKAWKVFSLYIRLRDKGICCTCQKQNDIKKMQAGHYMSRRYNATLFDEKNVHCQCIRCNVFDHGNMSEYAIFLIDKYGDGVLQELDEKKYLYHKFTRDELNEIIDKYKIKIRELEVENDNQNN